MISLYGIKNCDTVKKARKWLEVNGVKYQFHDLRDDGLEPALLQGWVKQLGWGKLLNRRSTTWRQLAKDETIDLDEQNAITLMLQYPTLIKRPVLDTGTECLTGFNAETWQSLVDK